MVLFSALTFTCFAGIVDGKITVDGIERNYILHIPKNYKGSSTLPLVLVFHGGGGNAKQMMNHTKFNKLSDIDGVFVLYPQAVDKNWSDGRLGSQLPEETDDVNFISNLIDTISAQYQVDTKRIFATGISNGGFFSFYLAYKLSGKILAVAPVTANIPENLKDEYKTEYPVSFLLINGTKDPLVKYDGGPVGFREEETGRGSSLSTDWTMRILTQNNGCQQSSKTEVIDDKDSDDGCTAEKITYYKCEDKTEVILVKIKGGGHTWPGASQYLPKLIIGNVCRDFSATEMIWDFFWSRSTR